MVQRSTTTAQEGSFAYLWCSIPPVMHVWICPLPRHQEINRCQFAMLYTNGVVGNFIVLQFLPDVSNLAMYSNTTSYGLHQLATLAIKIRTIWYTKTNISS
jgi:hypothetical protein